MNSQGGASVADHVVKNLGVGSSQTRLRFDDDTKPSWDIFEGDTI